MRVSGKHYQTLWYEDGLIHFIDQNSLPFLFRIHKTDDYRILCRAIIDMDIRGAGAIGVAAGWAMALAIHEADIQSNPDLISIAYQEIRSTRPTAQDLFHACDFVFQQRHHAADAIEAAQVLHWNNIQEAIKIGEFGEELIHQNTRILTHCNAGWLAFADWGSALAPVYKAARNNKSPFVYVDETRPRMQGARLTAWELLNENIDFRIIADNAAAHLMMSGAIDIVITGADRIACNGDIANKIGTLQKALAANYFGIPFYVAAPISTFDKFCESGKNIPIENRNEDEVLYIQGEDQDSVLRKIRIAAPGAHALNPAFDVCPANLISGIITSKGIIKANTEEILSLLE